MAFFSLTSQLKTIFLYYLFFGLYLIFFSWLITKINFLKNSGLRKRSLILLFLIKVMVGVFYGLITQYSANIGDNWTMHSEGVNEFHLLFSHPKDYVLNIFHDDYNNDYSGFLDTTDSYWNVLRSKIMAKLLSIFDIFSGCNYYINTIFYNFLVFFGFVAIFRIYNSIYTNKHKLLLISVFLLPSLLYFTSGIHKDGLIFLGIAITSYNVHLMLNENRFILKRILFIVIGLAIIFLLRNFVLITLIPALVAWWAAAKNNKYIVQTFAAIYISFTIIFFSLHLIGPRADLPRYVSERQIQFIKISRDAGSAINVNLLFPDFRSFLNNAPQALNHSLMRPYLTEKFSLAYIPVEVEIFLYEILFLLYLLFPLKTIKIDSFVCFGIFFSISMMMIIGYTIPIIGAIVRYRSIYFPFLIIPLCCSTDWSKLRFKRHNKKLPQTIS